MIWPLSPGETGQEAGLARTPAGEVGTVDGRAALKGGTDH